MQANKDHVLLVNQDSGYLMIDIANALADSGKSVTLLTGRLVERGTGLRASIEIKRIKKYNRRSTLTRLISWMVASVQILFQIWFHFRNSKLIITSNPAFAPILLLLVRNRYSLYILDVYPDALYETGMLSSGNLIIRLWQKANNRVFSKAQHVYTLTEGMQTVLTNYSGDRVVEVVPVWADAGFLKPIPKKENPFIRDHGLENKFVVMYSGNLGLTHELEILLEIASGIKDERIEFVIIGEGEKKKDLVRQAEISGLTNIRFLPYQPVEVLPFSLAAADIAVVTLGKGSSKLSVPSKTYSFMAVGVPLLCIAGDGSELWQLVTRHGIGKCFTASEIDEMCGFVKLMATDNEQWRTCAEKSLNASLNYSIANAAKIRV